MGKVKKRLKPRPPSLRKPTMDDLPALFDIFSDPRVWWNQTGSAHDDIDVTRAMLEQWIADWVYDALGIWVACTRNGEIVGAGGVRRCGNAWHLRYCVAPRHWHKGYGSYLAAAGATAATYFDKEMPVFLTTLRDNFTSCLIADKLDFMRVRNDFDSISGSSARRIYANRLVSAEVIQEYLNARLELLE